MEIDKAKIEQLILHYSRSKNYPEKSYLTGFTKDFELNYKQWYNYVKGDKNVGIKIIDFLVEVFPNLNLNWLLKDDEEMFVTSVEIKCLNEPSIIEYGKPENAIMDKLEAIHNDIKQMQKNYNLSQN